ncbi:MAG: redoxin domain-containing protein [Deltaproteobacteria bacterium]|nr:redoxin domain-containing protein [Deltaproteobacteria bacterium]
MDIYNRHSFGQSGQEPANFDSVAQVGTPAPDFTLTDLNGEKVSLSDFRGRKHIVLEFGNIT